MKMRKKFVLFLSWMNIHNFITKLQPMQQQVMEGLLKICAMEAFSIGVDSPESSRAETVVLSDRLLPSPPSISWAMVSVPSLPAESDNATIGVDSTCPISRCRRRSVTRPKDTRFLPVAFF
jgi:hypothetical protein